MSIKGFQLAWIVVNDIKKAIKFYTEVLGLELKEYEESFGWAELSGPEGARIGIAQKNDYDPIKPGQNAVVTITVDNFEESMADLQKKGIKTVGDVIEIPGIVKMQTVVDLDNNHLQIVQSFEH